MNKIKKYCLKLNNKYKNNYLKKIALYLMKASNQTGGEIISFIKNPNQGKLIRNSNLTSLLEFIKQSVNTKSIEGTTDDTLLKTSNKYCVIIIGPPASGKSLARKIAVKIIKKIFEEQLPITYNQIFNTFIDISVDDYVYGKKECSEARCKNGKQQIYDRTHKIFEENGYGDVARKKQLLEDPNELLLINKIENESFVQYRNLRKNIDSLGSLMMYIASYFNLNIFIETIASDESYVIDIINNFCKYEGYIPILIYPKIIDVVTHKERLNNRGIIEGRFPSWTYIETIIPKVDLVFEYFNNIFENKNDKIILIKYDNSKEFVKDNVDRYIFNVSVINGMYKYKLANREEIIPITTNDINL